MKHAFLLLIFTCAFAAGDAFAAEATVSVAPAKLILRPTTFDDTSGWQLLLLSVSNRTNRKWHFSNFYESWSPILLSATGEVAHPGMARDATRSPQRTDYPLIKPGQQTTAKRGCRVIRTEQGLWLILGDGTGGEFSTAVTPGDYKLSISYRAQTDGSPLFRLATERFGIERAQVWQGWIMSNWIDITIREEAK